MNKQLRSGQKKKKETKDHRCNHKLQKFIS